MKIDAALPIHLLHRRQVATLATHARDPAGFPYPTIVPYATDARHRPVVLISALAEHTRNLAADPRAGLLVAEEVEQAADGNEGGAVLEAQRMTLVGHAVKIDDDPHLAARYLRYHADASRYLALGDFSFWALECVQLRFIGGFGRMGWLDASALDPLPPLSFDEEQAVWESYSVGQHGDHRGPDLLGVDRHGADWRIEGRLHRSVFAETAVDADALRDCVQTAAADFAARDGRRFGLSQ